MAWTVAPASSSASACVRPRPRPPPDTTMTLSWRLNSGRMCCLEASAVADRLPRVACKARIGVNAAAVVGTSEAREPPRSSTRAAAAREIMAKLRIHFCCPQPVICYVSPVDGLSRLNRAS